VLDLDRLAARLPLHPLRGEPVMTVIDLYAGPGGWDEGMRNAGIHDVIGIEWEPNACVTAKAAGHARIRADVSRSPILPGTAVDGLVASPPCQAWSMAGKRQGEHDRVQVHHLIDAYAAGSDDIGTGWADPRSHHAAQPIRWVRDLRPRWVCFEQVPPVLGLWQHASDVLRRWGYSTWTGVLNSADYGVPQTRERAVLMARLGKPVHPPAPTHAKHPEGADLFGGELLPWVSMAEALGWPADTEIVSNYNSGGVLGNPGRRNADEPSFTLTSKADRTKVMLHTNRDQRPDGSRQVIDPQAVPAPTLTGKSGGQWVLRNGTNACTRPADQPAGTLFFGARLNNVSWVHERPATTVAGDPRISAPGHRDRAGGERQHEKSIRITMADAAVLQSFPADYPWQGTKTAQFLQVGNAVPPRLAEAVVRAVTA
jgi:DNA (cytosine-5)-methyltransferase 1